MGRGQAAAEDSSVSPSRPVAPLLLLTAAAGNLEGTPMKKTLLKACLVATSLLYLACAAEAANANELATDDSSLAASGGEGAEGSGPGRHRPPPPPCPPGLVAVPIPLCPPPPPPGAQPQSPPAAGGAGQHIPAPPCFIPPPLPPLPRECEALVNALDGGRPALPRPPPGGHSAEGAPPRPPVLFICVPPPPGGQGGPGPQP